MSSRDSNELPSKNPLMRVDPVKLRRRNRAEIRFRLMGAMAIGFALTSLVVLLASIGWRGVSVFTQSRIELVVSLDASEIDPKGTRSVEALGAANYTRLIRQSLHAQFPDVSARRDKRQLYALVSQGAGYEVRSAVLAHPEIVGAKRMFVFPLSAEADLYEKGRVVRGVLENQRKLTDQQMDWLDDLRDRGLIERVFNRGFFTHGDSREPELAGVGGAVVGSLLTLMVTLLVCLPIGVAAAVHLEEFAPKNRLTALIEVNINNLAAVPSIVFGLLGLAIFLGFMGMPRSAPLVGGLVLALRTLPIIIIVSRAALAAVPPSIREAALGLGASRLQLVAHHLIPLALPGILTGSIIGMAQALGETAPLLMVGMVAFVVDIPNGLLSPATVLPVQVFLWSDAPERGFETLTAGAIIVLLVFLLLLNGVAVYLRQRFETRF